MASRATGAAIVPTDAASYVRVQFMFVGMADLVMTAPPGRARGLM